MGLEVVLKLLSLERVVMPWWLMVVFKGVWNELKAVLSRLECFGEIELNFGSFLLSAHNSRLIEGTGSWIYKIGLSFLDDFNYIADLLSYGLES